MGRRHLSSHEFVARNLSKKIATFNLFFQDIYMVVHDFFIADKNSYFFASKSRKWGFQHLQIEPKRLSTRIPFCFFICEVSGNLLP